MAALLKELQVLSALMILGFVVRELCKPIQKLYIPTSMVAGFLGLLLGPQVLGLMEIPKGFGGYAGALINVVLTCIVLGLTFSKSRLARYIDYACVCIGVWGLQLMIGVPLGDLMAKFWPSLPKGWGLLGVFSFWGGHGTAGGAGKALEQLGSEGALGIGMILSTIGLMSAVTVGMALVNWGIRKGYAAYTKVPASGYDPTLGGVLPSENQKATGFLKVSSSGINALVLQFCLVLFSMWLGGVFFKTLAKVLPAAAKVNAMVHGMLGAAVIRVFMAKTGTEGYLDIPTVKNISGCSLDILILGAVSTLRLELMSTFMVPILVFAFASLFITMVLGTWLCKIICREEWFERACCLFGMASGAVPTGLALVRAVDPDGKCSAPDAQGIASSAWSPVFGSMPAILPALYYTSPESCTYIGAGIFFVPVILGMLLFARRK